MKYDILGGNDINKKIKAFKLNIALCVALIALVLAINLTLLFCCTDKTRLVFTVVNIVTDLLTFFFVYAFCAIKLSYDKKIINIVQQGIQKTEITGTVSKVNGNTIKVCGLDMFSANVQTDNGIRKVFFIDDAICELSGKTVEIMLFDNVVVSVQEVANE